MTGFSGLLNALHLFVTTGSLQMAAQWCGLWFLLGLLFLPLPAQLLGRLPDRGYLFARVMGLCLAGYVMWLTAGAGWLRFGRVEAAALLIGSAAVLWGVWWWRGGPRRWPLPSWQVMLSRELVFLGCLVAWAFVRSLAPEVNTLEKPMDFGFINSCLNSPTMPPPDMWWSGGTINYYYFGHYLTAWLLKLWGTDPGAGYNLMVASLFALAFGQVYSLSSGVAALGERLAPGVCRLAGLASALLFTMGGSVHTFVFGAIGRTLYLLGWHHPSVKSYRFSDPTRYIGHNPPTDDRCITEFPAYSFIVADLHAHVLAIPLALTFLALLLALLLGLWARDREHSEPTERVGWRGPLIAGGVLLGLLYMCNAWAFPIYLLATTVVLAGTVWHHGWRDASRRAVPLVLLMAGLAVVTVLPFQAHFAPFSKGLRLVSHATPVYQLAVLWGYHAFILLWYWRGLPRRRDQNPGLKPTEVFISGLALAAVILIALPELVYVRDIYGLPFCRANTMFKLTFEAFAMATVVVGPAALAVAIRPRAPGRQTVTALLLVTVLYLPLLYSWVALAQAYHLPHPGQYRGLDGLAFLDREEPGARAAAQWLHDHTAPGAIILEADTPSYEYGARLSMASARPTVLGWYAHEWLWRGDKKAVQVRHEHVQRIYETSAVNEARRLLRRYDVAYVVLGKVERKRYKRLHPAVLHELGPVVFSQGEVAVIAVTR